MASEERSALLAPNHDESDPAMAYENDHDEPKQTLLTALGRFQRQVAKAQAGARQDEWSDDCMNHLIGAVEIAIDQDWVDVVEALTDTARILHSYEDANRAARCVPFLADSYELICLMVGDLIVDNVRPSVMEKWRRRFAVALEELQAEGLRLIQDDEPHDGSTPHALDVSQSEARPSVARVPDRAPEDDSPFEPVTAGVPAAERAPDDELPALDELPPLQGAERVGVESIAAHDAIASDSGLEPIDPMSVGGTDDDALPEMPMIGDVGYLPIDPEPFGMRSVVASPRVQPETAATSDARPRDDAPVTHSFEEIESEFDDSETLDREEGEAPETGALESPEQPEEEDSTEALYALDEPPARRGLEPAVVQHLDALCDELARLERGEELDRGIVFATIDGRLDSLRIHAHSGRRPNAETLCGTMAALCADVARSSASLGDKFFELAYAFCGLYADADADGDSPLEASWYDEVAALRQADQPSALTEEYPKSDETDRLVGNEPDEEAVFELPDDVAPNEPEDGDAVEDLASVLDRPLGSHLESTPNAKSAATAEMLLSLLTGAQRAAAVGDIVHAKSLALEAAVKIAEAEVEASQDALHTADRHLDENRAELEDAHIGAAAAEALLGECEAHVADGESALSDVRQRIADTQGTLAGVERRITEIEEQIRKLEAERDAELARADEVRTTLEQERRMEADGVSALEQRQGDEAAARSQLDAARRRIASLEAQREATQSERRGAEASLDDKRQSLVELEQTVRLIQAKIDGTDR